VDFDLGAIRWRLTRRYALISSLVLLVFCCGVYFQVADSRSRLMRLQLEQMASASASQMPLILHELAELSVDSPKALRNELAEIGMLDSQSINLADKRIVWFDREIAELSRYGNYEPQGGALIPAGRRQQAQFIALANGLAYWRPVFVRHSTREAAELRGYVLVALSSNGAQAELQRLRYGLLAGGSLALVAAILLSQWMVASSIQPVREQLERLVRFTADASHELRHPLTAIRAVIGSIWQRGLLAGGDPEITEKIGLVDRATRQMAALLDDLLLLARLDQSLPDNAHWVRFDLVELIDDLLDLHRETAQIRAIELVADLVGPLPIRGCPERLRQLLNNVISNALRFSPEAGRVWVDLARQGQVIQLSVEDEGPGIPVEQRQLVFERFWRADQARSGLNVGLGLAIAHAIASSHGGSLEAQVGHRGGCRMVLSLPSR
jgi:two-component system OmpR family sensor kinase